MQLADNSKSYRWIDNQKFLKNFIDRAVAENIQNSLMCQKLIDGEYKLLLKIYQRDHLTDMIQRIVGSTMYQIVQ